MTDKKLSNLSWLEAGGMSRKMLFHFKLSMGKFRWNVLELFFSNCWTRGGRKNFKLRNRPTFQDQSDSPSSSLEFYKSCKLELASKFISAWHYLWTIPCRIQNLFENRENSRAMTKATKFSNQQQNPKPRSENQAPSGALTSKSRKNGLSFKSRKRETESKRLKVPRKKD
jgi:hypothetical protein